MQKYYQTTLRLWKLLKPFHKDFYLQLLSIVIQQVIQVYVVFIIAKVLDNVISKDYNKAYTFIFLWLGVSLVKLVISYFTDMHSLKKMENHIQQYLEQFSFKNIFKLNASQYIEDHSAIKLQVINRGEFAIEQIIKMISLSILPTVTQIIFSLCAIAYYSVPIAGVATLTLFIVVFWSNYFAQHLRPFIKKNTDNWDEQRKVRTEAFQHLSLIKINSVEDSYVKNYLENRNRYIQFAINTWKKRIVHGHKRWSFFSISKTVSSMLLIFYASIGTLTIGAIYAIWMWLNDAYNNIFNVIHAMRDIPLRFVELEKYLNIIDKEPEFDENGKVNFSAGDIKFDSVSFKYPKGDKDVMENITLTIPRGKKVAFVGVSGSGKSTIIKLLLRMYDYADGSIKINNTELKDINSTSLRMNIGYVEQHVDLFDTTIRENILFGLEDKNVSEDKIKEVVHKARIDQFFHRLSEKGLDTQIGERGVKLSGGERQRIGIARALIKNPDILIFDEATASLDTENEKYIQEAIDESSVGRTSIIIAHRLSTIQNADIIFVMNKGKLVGSGTHSELLGNNEYYQTLVQHQG